jgi:hypothetical protein
MRSVRKTGVAVGVLFLLAMLSYMPGSELVAASLDAAHRFAGVDIGQLRIGVLLLEFVNCAAVRRHRGAAVPGDKAQKRMGRRSLTPPRGAIEAGLLIACSACALSPGVLGPDAVDAAGEALLSLREALFQMAMILPRGGSVALCRVLYRGRLVPHALALLGVAGYAALFSAAGWACSYKGRRHVPVRAGAAFESRFRFGSFSRDSKTKRRPEKQLLFCRTKKAIPSA